MTRFQPDLRTIAFFACAAGIALFAFSAVEYFTSYTTKPFTFWDRVMARTTSEAFLVGEGSIRAETYAPYSAHRFWMQMHATSGGIMLILGLFQFWTPLRQNRPALHRMMGKAYVIMAIPMSTGSIAYLLSVPPDNIFSGKVFMAALAGLAAATLFATGMAYVTARRRQFKAHQAWMLQSYFYILSAPILRLLWIITYQVNDSMTQWDNNLYAVVPTAAAIAFGPLIVLTFTKGGVGHVRRSNG